MGILDSILHAFTGAAQQAPTPAEGTTPGQDDNTKYPPPAKPDDEGPDAPGQLDTPAGEPAPAPQPSTPDVNSILAGLAAKTGATDYQHSVVDLMHLFGVDSSLGAREELAHELGYTGDTSDTAAMNEWLHAKLMENIAEHGGKLALGGA